LPATKEKRGLGASSSQEVRRIRRGATEHEIETVYRTRFNDFCSVANAILHDREQAKDAVQEAAASALVRRHQWRGRGSLDAWMWRAVVNAANDHRRKQKRKVSGAIANGSGELPASDALDAQETELRLAVAALPERQRLIVFLRYYGDLDYQAIASVVGVKAGTVAASLHQAQGTLRRLIEASP
jgi:RNA polymerase sigma factor (sigma-70 family)